jgi:hypothetical protein
LAVTFVALSHGNVIWRVLVYIVMLSASLVVGAKAFVWVWLPVFFVGQRVCKYLPLNNRHIFGRLFFDYTSLLFTAIVKTITENNASFSKKISATKNDDYLTLGTYRINMPR